MESTTTNGQNCHQAAARKTSTDVPYCLIENTENLAIIITL